MRALGAVIHPNAYTGRQMTARGVRPPAEVYPQQTVQHWSGKSSSAATAEVAGDLQMSRSSARDAADLLMSARAMLSFAQVTNPFLPTAASVHGTRLDASVLPRAGWP